ncbi:DUF2029 domain-containing protein [bacterium]|nr:DUF2029 domain-containing protein [bacterium]
MTAETSRFDLKKWLRYGVTVIAAFYVYRHMALLVFRESGRGDLDILLTAGKRFSDQQAVYLITDYSEHTKPPLLNPILAWLSQAPATWVHTFWDLLLLPLPFITLVLWCRNLKKKGAFFPTAAAIAVMGPLWFTEAGYGQYNLVLLAITLLSLLWYSDSSSIRQHLAGVLFYFSVILKPTQILYLALFIAPIRALRRSILFLSGIATGGLASVAVYLWYRPWPILVSDLAQWKDFISASQTKNIFRTDNYGIPTLLARNGVSWAQSPWITFLGLFLAFFVWKKIRNRELALALIIVLSIVFSPMAWRQNFVLLLPVAYELAVKLTEDGHDLWSWLGIFSLFTLARFNPHWVSSSAMELWATYCGPGIIALLATIALALASRSKRHSA